MASAVLGIGMRAMLTGTVTGASGVALTLRVPILVRSGGRSVIGFVTSGSVEPGDLLIAACPTLPAGVVGRSLAGTGELSRSCVNGQTGHGSVNGVTMRMMNSAATSFLSANGAYSSIQLAAARGLTAVCLFVMLSWRASGKT